jgi:thiamine biosynthesis lipoprotein
MAGPGPVAAEQSGYATRRFPALGTTAMVATASGQAIDMAEAVLRHEVGAIDRACSRFRAGSEVCRLDEARGLPVPVSRLLAQAVAAALMAAEMTDGAVDPTVGAAMIGLGYDRDFDEVPRDSAVPATPRTVPGWRCLELNSRNGRLRAPEGVVIDLGATAKALASDRAAARIAELTGTAVLVNLGGDISVAGAPRDGWAVGIAPDCATPPSATDVVVALREGGLATSGTSVRTWRRADRQVHHIVDPRTGDSARTCWQLVSVAAPSCVIANAASTAAIVWGEDAPQRLSAMGLPCRLVGNDGSVLALNGWPASSSPAGFGGVRRGAVA